MATWTEGTVLVSRAAAPTGYSEMKLAAIPLSLQTGILPARYKTSFLATSLGLGMPLSIVTGVRNSRIIYEQPRNKRFYYWHN